MFTKRMQELKANGPDALKDYLKAQSNKFTTMPDKPQIEDALLMLTMAKLSHSDSMAYIITLVMLEDVSREDMIKLNEWSNHELTAGAALLDTFDISVEELTSKTYDERKTESIPILMEQLMRA